MHGRLCACVQLAQGSACKQGNSTTQAQTTCTGRTLYGLREPAFAVMQAEQGRLQLAQGAADSSGGSREEGEAAPAAGPAPQEQFEIPKQLKQRVVMVSCLMVSHRYARVRYVDDHTVSFYVMESVRRPVYMRAADIICCCPPTMRRAISCGRGLL